MFEAGSLENEEPKLEKSFSFDRDRIIPFHKHSDSMKHLLDDTKNQNASIVQEPIYETKGIWFFTLCAIILGETDRLNTVDTANLIADFNDDDLNNILYK